MIQQMNMDKGKGGSPKSLSLPTCLDGGNIFLDFHLHHETLIRLPFSTTIKLTVNREILHQIAISSSSSTITEPAIKKTTNPTTTANPPLTHKPRMQKRETESRVLHQSPLVACTVSIHPLQIIPINQIEAAILASTIAPP
ncbi:uncharacterized protein HKW66_Vig0237600 [Vigna angularis]|uniref:Uncharacterized protein n=1 Tax=Phaseolus angularis TaxID=3914 RepID=A0A8T0KWD3_PHAAN|nr:uncharacterized protein HKW66_Vig0237600 [Vigna angularis]